VSPRKVTDLVHRDPPVVRDDTPLRDVVRLLLDEGLPAVPVVDAEGRYVGIFGEREFIAALFPRYVQSLSYAGFIPKPIEEVLEKRREAASEPIREHMTTEHVDVPADASDVQIAETFLHHRVRVLPVTENGRVVGIILRGDFMRALAESFLDQVDDDRD
jgi:CBS domain-containing protein